MLVMFEVMIAMLMFQEPLYGTGHIKRNTPTAEGIINFASSLGVRFFFSICFFLS